MGIFISRGKNSRFKVMFLIAEDWYFLSHRQPLAQACRDLGWEVVIATRVHRHGETIRGMGFSLIPIQMDRRSRNPFKELRTIFELVRILAQERPNIVHQVGLKPVIYGSIAAMFCPPDVVVNALAGMGYVFTGSHYPHLRMVRAVIRTMLYVCMRPTNRRLLAQNDEDAAAFMVGGKIDPDRVTVIRGSGVNVDHYVPVPEPEGEVVVAVVSRMLKDKGIREVVLAARELKRRGIKVRVFLVGRPDSGNPSSISEDTLRQWHREGCVEWLGHQDNIAAVWSKAHIAVLPSYREGLPKSLLEAAACGRPLSRRTFRDAGMSSSTASTDSLSRPNPGSNWLTRSKCLRARANCGSGWALLAAPGSKLGSTRTSSSGKRWISTAGRRKERAGRVRCLPQGCRRLENPLSHREFPTRDERRCGQGLRARRQPPRRPRPPSRPGRGRRGSRPCLRPSHPVPAGPFRPVDRETQPGRT